jgi:hypothetical protein
VVYLDPAGTRAIRPFAAAANKGPKTSSGKRNYKDASLSSFTFGYTNTQLPHLNKVLVGQFGYALNGSGRGFGTARTWLKANSKGTAAQFPGQKIITFFDFSVRFRVRANQDLGGDYTYAEAKHEFSWFSGGGAGPDKKWSYDFAKTGEAYFGRTWSFDRMKFLVDVLFTFTSADCQRITNPNGYSMRSRDFIVDGKELYFP